MPPRALLFDFDGVIADTENIHIAAWQRTFLAMGWEEPEAVCVRAAEVDDRAFLAEVFARRKIEGGDVAGWVARKQALTLAMLADSPRIYPGVADLVRAVAGRASLAIVSTTWRDNIAVVLNAARLADAFEFLVGKEDVTAIKPDPEGYRLALKRLGLDAADAVALEDSPTGLAAARGAGLRAIALGHRRTLGDWVGTADFIPDFTQTARVIKALGLD